MSKQPVVYYSYSGTTRSLAEDIAAECPDSKLLPGLAPADGWTLEEVRDWLTGLGVLE